MLFRIILAAALALSAAIPITPSAANPTGQDTSNGLNLPVTEKRTTGIRGFAEGVVHGGEGLVRGVVNTVVHPINTIKGTASAIIHPIKTVKAVSQNFKEECKDKGKAECAGKAVFNVGTAVVAPIGVAKVVGAVGKSAAVEESIQAVDHLPPPPLRPIVSKVPIDATPLPGSFPAEIPKVVDQPAIIAKEIPLPASQVVEPAVIAENIPLAAKPTAEVPTTPPPAPPTRPLPVIPKAAPLPEVLSNPTEILDKPLNIPGSFPEGPSLAPIAVAEPLSKAIPGANAAAEVVKGEPVKGPIVEPIPAIINPTLISPDVGGITEIGDIDAKIAAAKAKFPPLTPPASEAGDVGDINIDSKISETEAKFPPLDTSANPFDDGNRVVTDIFGNQRKNFLVL